MFHNSGTWDFKVSNLDAWENFATQILGIESVGRNEKRRLDVPDR